MFVSTRATTVSPLGRIARPAWDTVVPRAPRLRAGTRATARVHRQARSSQPRGSRPRTSRTPLPARRPAAVLRARSDRFVESFDGGQHDRNLARDSVAPLLERRGGLERRGHRKKVAPLFGSACRAGAEGGSASSERNVLPGRAALRRRAVGFPPLRDDTASFRKCSPTERHGLPPSRRVKSACTARAPEISRRCFPGLFMPLRDPGASLSG